MCWHKPCKVLYINEKETDKAVNENTVVVRGMKEIGWIGSTEKKR